MGTQLLVVDASPAVHRLVEQASSGEGYEVSAFKDALAALDAAPQRKPDLIIADYHLDGMPFPDFCERIRAAGIAPGAPVIALVNFSDRIDEESLRAIGVRAFVKKPLQPEHLVQAIKHLKQSVSSRLSPAPEQAKSSGKAQAETEGSSAPMTPSPSHGWMRDRKSSSASDAALDESLRAFTAQLVQVAGEHAQQSVSQVLPDLVAKDLRDQLKDILKSELPAVLPQDELARLTKETVEKSFSATAGRQIEALLPQLQKNLETSARDLVRDLVDQYLKEHLEDVVKKRLPELMKDQLGSLEKMVNDAAAQHAKKAAEDVVREIAKAQIEQAVKTIIPDQAEEAIQKEIARLTSSPR